MPTWNKGVIHPEIDEGPRSLRRGQIEGLPASAVSFVPSKRLGPCRDHCLSESLVIGVRTSSLAPYPCKLLLILT